MCLIRGEVRFYLFDIAKIYRLPNEAGTHPNKNAIECPIMASPGIQGSTAKKDYSLGQKL
jgi:hypothetical protein